MIAEPGVAKPERSMSGIQDFLSKPRLIKWLIPIAVEKE